MKALIRTAPLLLLIAAVGGCGGSSSSTPITKPIAYLYAVGQGNNAVLGMLSLSDGSLSSLPLSNFPTAAIPVAVALPPSKNFMYVANSTSNAVSGFNFNHVTGDLTPIGTALVPTPAGTNPVSLGVNFGGQFLLVLNQGSVSPAAAASISVFNIDPTRGLLTPVSGSPFTFASLTAPNPAFMVLSPTANFAYVANGAAGNISAFSIDAGGVPHEISLSPFAAGGTIAGMTIDPKGQFLYAADQANNNVVSFSIGASGGLTAVAGSPVAAGTQPLAVAIDSTGSFLYAANHGSNNVSAFKVSSGALTQVSGSPFATAGTSTVNPTQPSFLTVDITNGFLYVANQGSRDIAAFSINASTGALTTVTNSPFGEGVAPTFLLSTK